MLVDFIEIEDPSGVMPDSTGAVRRAESNNVLWLQAVCHSQGKGGMVATGALFATEEHRDSQTGQSCYFFPYTCGRSASADKSTR
jgi:hypothetical protein